MHHRREQHLHAEPVSTVVVPYDIGRARLSLAGVGPDRPRGLTNVAQAC